jgi:hypothetical protein
MVQSNRVGYADLVGAKSMLERSNIPVRAECPPLPRHLRSYTSKTIPLFQPIFVNLLFWSPEFHGMMVTGRAHQTLRTSMVRCDSERNRASFAR